MKSTKPTPFDWQKKTPSLFTATEKATMNFFSVAKSTERKQLKIYSKAGAK